MAAKITAAQKAERTARRNKTVAVATFLAGAFASIAANMIAAEPGVVAKAVSAWPALALLATTFLFHTLEKTGFAAKLGVLAVAGVAGWVSYWHIVEVALGAGESVVSAHLMPVPVDAMMAVAVMVLQAKPKPARRKPATRRPAAKATVTKLRSA